MPTAEEVPVHPCLRHCPHAKEGRKRGRQGGEYTSKEQDVSNDIQENEGSVDSVDEKGLKAVKEGRRR